MIRTVGVGDNVVDRCFHKGLMYPGGNSTNFAVYSRRMGYETAYVGILADDLYAGLVEDSLRKEGVDFSRCVRRHGETGLCSTRYIDGDRTITDDNDGGVLKSEPLVIDDELLAYLKTFDIVHMNINGYIDSQVRVVSEAGIPVIYDASDLWVDEEHLMALTEHATFAFFSGKELPAEEYKRLLSRMCERGCELAICTVGKKGAVVCRNGVFFEKEPYNMGGKVVDTIGAGDSFLTGFITTYIEGKKKYRHLTEGREYMYCTSPDKTEYFEDLVKHAMSVGNLMAIRTCMVSGSYGYAAKLV